MCCTIVECKQQGYQLHFSCGILLSSIPVFAHKYAKAGERGISDSEARVKDLIVWKRQQVRSFQR